MYSLWVPSFTSQVAFSSDKSWVNQYLVPFIRTGILSMAETQNVFVFVSGATSKLFPVWTK